jgi:hypothetical protein
MSDDFRALATYRKLTDGAAARWAPFTAKRQQRLVQAGREHGACEKVSEGILEDLFTEVLDWSLAEVNHQVEFADVVITQFGIKRLMVEAKRPGSLTWSRPAVERALEQVRRYAAEQRVSTVAISDGLMFYAADVADGGLKDRLYVSLAADRFPETLWWISRDGIYRPPVAGAAPPIVVLSPASVGAGDSSGGEGLVHPKYDLPCRCFAYVGNAAKTSTWKLPYLLADGAVDERRLPKAIQCLLTNYRGERVGSVPEAAVPDTLVRLAGAARRSGKLPDQNPATADIYRQLAAVLNQLGRTTAG